MTPEIQDKYFAKRDKMKYMIFDLECENHKYKGRVASQFCEDNYISMAGWKVQGDEHASYWYEPKKNNRTIHIPDDVNMLVGHNIKYDLLWIWHTPELRAFLERGGVIWDTQTAEYLLRGMTQEYHFNSMDEIAPTYGGTTKIDAVKELWEQGFKTSEIDPDLLKDYLIGTEEEGYNAGDIGNTEKMFLGQWELAQKQLMVPVIEERMNHLLAICEMEYNGLYIDQELGEEIREENLDKLEVARDNLNASLPDMPEECEFNWGSGTDVSCLLFGGHKKWKRREHLRDEQGQLMYAKKKVPMPILDDNLNPIVNKSGKNKGLVKTKLQDVDDHTRPKMKYIEYYYKFSGLETPLHEWKGSKTTGLDEPIYSVGADTMKYLKKVTQADIIKNFIDYKALAKDTSTYFNVITKVRSINKVPNKKGEMVYDYIEKDTDQLTMEVPEGYQIETEKGMLTLIGDDGKIHHQINTNAVKTGRLSSSGPNMQNIPKASKSKIKQLFRSRFKQGLMSEVDYSQLEVVALGVLSQDEQLIKDLIAKIDFHCKRVAMKYRDDYPDGYEQVKAIKDDGDIGDVDLQQFAPEMHKLLDARRTACKILSFQKQYGAGAKTIAKTLNLPLEEVVEMLRLEDEMYPGVVKFNEIVEATVNRSSRRYYVSKWKKQVTRGRIQVKSGTIYSFDAMPAPQWMKDQGINESFPPPNLKNFPVQGTGGEMVQSSVGRLFRAMVNKGYWSGGNNPHALLVNTVHDCVWLDFMNKAIAEEVLPMVKYHLENIPKVYMDLYEWDVKVPFPVAAEIGESMYDLHHIDVVANKG